jgi:cell shape-determining protein MreC
VIGPHAHRTLFLVLVALMVAIIVFVPQWGWWLRAMLSPVAPSQGISENAAAENLALMAQLAQYRTVAAQLPNAAPNYVRAMVYSRYPSDLRNEFLIDAGTDDGIGVGKAVVIQAATSSYVLVGKIQSVAADTAVVETVFDPSFRMPVRVGAHGYDGLLVGGVYPTVTSVLKGAAIQTGDVVVNAGASLPYGLPVAEIGNIGATPDNLFQGASLTFSYDVNGIQTVLVAQ